MKEAPENRFKYEPECEECDVELYRYENSPDTGKSGWACPDCGFSWDDIEDFHE